MTAPVQIALLPVVDDGILRSPIAHPTRPGVLIFAELGSFAVLGMNDTTGRAYYWAETDTHETADDWPSVMGCIAAVSAGARTLPDPLADCPTTAALIWSPTT